MNIYTKDNVVKNVVLCTIHLKLNIISFSRPRIDTTPIYKENPLKRNKKKKVYVPVTNKIKSPYKLYKENVWQLTEKTVHLLPNIHLRAFREYHVNHKISIRYGFEHNIDYKKIADITNLRMIKYVPNIGTMKANYIIDTENNWILCE